MHTANANGNGAAHANGVNGSSHKIKVARPVVDLDGDEMTRCVFGGGGVVCASRRL
jgi:hypothetical protein